MEGLLSIVIVLVILGLVLYLITLLPIDAKIKQIINVLVIVVIIIWLLQLLLGGHVLVFHADLKTLKWYEVADQAYFGG